MRGVFFLLLCFIISSLFHLELKVAPRAEVIAPQSCLFVATYCSSCVFFTPIFALSLLIVLLKVSLGLPTGRLRVGAHLKV